MEAKAILRTARISPQKARLVAAQVRGLPAEASFLRSISRTLRSEGRYSAYSFLPAYHFEFQSLEMPRRMPVG